MKTKGTKQKMKETKGEEVKQVQEDDNTGIMEMITQLIRQFTETIQEHNRKANEAITKALKFCPNKREHAKNQNIVDFDKEEPRYIKVLGLQWNPIIDAFSYLHSSRDSVVTKKHIVGKSAVYIDL
ncbi:hypothetical protein FQA39_LY09699 [Lamprigera yunnana]|nr:hypothetical protein FQA39_LY09699 [Lamprigera yunnana]